MKRIVAPLCLLALLSCLAFAQSASVPPTPTSKFVAVESYDPARDASKDIADAAAEAARTHRLVLVEIGGKWCIWCTYFDKFFATNDDMRQLRDKNFVMVKVNFSPENKNEAVISRYGTVPGYPHLFVLDDAGKLVHSQDTSTLEQGRGYSKEAVQTFLDKWVPKKS